MGNRTAMYWVLIGTDESGSFPLLLTDEEALPGLPGSSVQWQLVARTGNEHVAARLMRKAHADCSHPLGAEVRIPGGPRSRAGDERTFWRARGQRTSR